MQPSRTKIVATLGPATSSVDIVAALAQAGADVFRLNLSHCTRAQHVALLTAVRSVAADTCGHLAVLADLAKTGADGDADGGVRGLAGAQQLGVERDRKSVV